MRLFLYLDEETTFPNMKAIIRCFAHGGQKCLENSMRSNPDVNNLLEKVIVGPNSLARNLKNSHKLAAMLAKQIREEFEKIPEISNDILQSSNFAAQRWDSILQILRLVVVRLDPILKMLAQVAALESGDMMHWAIDMLKACKFPKKCQ